MKRKKEVPHPVFGTRSFGQRAADNLTKWAGSWTFIISFLIFIALWMCANVYFFIQYKLGKPWDPYPFILLNLVLSCLAAFQAPVILMSQNRETQRDRMKVEHDYIINKKAEREIEQVQEQLKRIERKLNERK